MALDVCEMPDETCLAMSLVRLEPVSALYPPKIKIGIAAQAHEYFDDSAIALFV